MSQLVRTATHPPGDRERSEQAGKPRLKDPSSIPVLGIWDAMSIMIGIVVGTAIFRSPTVVFQNVTGPWEALGVWLIGGILCIFGAFCYAELATTYPRNGGDYEYLSRAYGRITGFLFGWAQLTVVLTGSIGAMAYVFADYGRQLWSLPDQSTALIATIVVVALSALNLLGLIIGKTLQNLLTGAKVLGLLGVVIAGIGWGEPSTTAASPAATGLMGPGLGLALVFVLYAYGGWSDAVFVTAEIRRGDRNLPRALVLGVAGITIVYLAVIASYLSVLGFEAARQTPTPAADVLERALGSWGARAISLLVMVSALGAINGMILAGSRVFATVGEDHRLFAWLSKWNRNAAPTAAVITQAGFSLLLLAAVGTPFGRDTIDRSLSILNLAGLPWNRYLGGFETLVAGTAPVFWAFFLLTGVSLFILRMKDSGRMRPFTVPWYPLPPIVFILMCLYMLYSSVAYAGWLTLLGLLPLACGIPLYFLSHRQ